MTFEQKLKDILKADLKELFGQESEYNKIVNVSNDISTKMLEKENSFLAVVKTGQGLRTAIPDYDVVNLSLYIEFYFDKNFLQTFLSEMQNYIKNKNGHEFVAEINEEEVNYQVNYNNPTPSATALDIQVEGKTMQFCQVVLIGEVIYSSQVSFNKPIIVFKYDEEDEYVAKNILNYDYISQPSYETIQYLGEENDTKEIINYESTHSLSVLVTEDDEFIQFMRSGFVQTKSMILQVDDIDYKIQIVVVNYNWNNKSKVLNITFVE